MSHPLVVSSRRAPTFSLSTDDDGAVTAVRARGELDGATAPALIAHVDHLVAAHSPLLLVLDLDGISFLGAAGITALLHVRDVLRGNGCHLLLRGPSEPVRTVLRLSRMIDAFDVKEIGETPGTHIPSEIG